MTRAGPAIYDAFAALIIHGVFRRFPRVRVCSIENDSEWVSPLLHKLAKACGQMAWEFPGGDPVESFKRHCFVAPHYEDEIRALTDAIGASQVLMRFDWPHAEGIVEPIHFVEDLASFGADEVRLITRGARLHAVSRARRRMGVSSRDSCRHQWRECTASCAT